MRATPAAPTARARSREPWLLAFPALALLGLVAWPLALVLQDAGDAAAWHWMGDDFALASLRGAALQAALSTMLALALGLPLAWLYHARRIRGERLHLALHAAPFVMPVFVVVYGLQDTVGGRSPLHAATGLNLLAAGGALGAVVLAHAYYNYGFVARYLHAALERRPRRLEDAARLLGAPPASTLRRITLPAILPSLLCAALLVFLFCFASFGTVLLLGNGVVRTLETVLYEKYYTGEHAKAAVLGLVQLAINAALLAAFFVLRQRSLRLPPQAAPRPPPRARLATQAAALALLALAIAPLAAVLVGGFRLSGQWSLEPWRNLLAGPSSFNLGRALLLTVAYGLGATGAAFTLCACIAYGAWRFRPAARRAVEAAASLPIATSSVLVGFGLLLAYGHAGFPDLAGSVWIVLAAHVVLVFPFAARTLLPAFEARDRRLDDAARLLGAPTAHVAGRLHWPTLRAPALVALGFGLALSFGDFGASSLLGRTDTTGLAVWTYRLDGAFDPLLHARATALAALLGALTAAALLLVERAGRAAQEPL